MISKLEDSVKRVVALTTSRPEALEALTHAADATAYDVRETRATRTREEYSIGTRSGLVRQVAKIMGLRSRAALRSS